MEHPIRSWLAASTPPMTVSDFAAKVGISRIHLGRLMRARGNFNTEIFEKIETVTGGALSAVGLFAHYQQQRAEAARAARTHERV